MSMPNLLPWRRQQRNQRLRFWGLLFAASLLVMLAGGFSLRATQSLALQALQSELAGTRAVQKVLRARQPQSAGLKTPSPPSDPAWQREQQTRKEQERAQRLLDAPLHSHSIPFAYADAAELQKAAEKLLSPKGSLSVDKRTNRFLVRDNQTVVDMLQRWAVQMDLPVEQVELAAQIVTISEKSLRELGVKWNLADATEASKVGQVTTLGADLSVASATTHAGFNIGRINGRMLDLELSALEQKQQVDIIASPRLLASHMQPASIKQGSEIPYQVSSGESGATSVEFKEAVLGMEVTPVVLPGGRVRLKLHISENMPGQVLQQADGETLAIDKQEIETQVEVKSGETLALGGIFSQKNKTGRDSVPVLGNIPWLGQLFRHDGKDNERRELVVFITPRLVSIQ
ncbi:porin [Enterobacter hormaechei subsp. xiangfangensis]|nr:porin [Enterobacter hormaechei subsp. xiangfangensis]KJO89472.1 porin [Enterobacter hormaechei subsp. xiangfangensis]KJP03943.1 porin [Enterobacter hormaechei subsp. xiangfangensis]